MGSQIALVLRIKRRWMRLIMAGEKTWELRRQRFNLEGCRIGLACSETKRIWATATVREVFLASLEHLSANFDKHGVSSDWLQMYAGEKTHLVVYTLERVTNLCEPYLYDAPRGCVSLVRATQQMREDVAEAEGSSMVYSIEEADAALAAAGASLY